MQEDEKSTVTSVDNVRNETESLKKQLEDLKAECSEKVELMKKLISEQESKKGEIELELEQSITKQVSQLEE